MRPIPKEVRDQLASDPRMTKCALCGTRGLKLEWHHNLTEKGRQSDRPETILALCKLCHDNARDSDVKERLDLIMLRMMTPETISEISKAVDYHQRLKYLESKYVH